MCCAIMDDDARERGELEARLRRFYRREEGGEGEEFLHVETFAGGHDFLAAHAPGRFDLMLLDCMLGPGRPDGIAVAREVRARGDRAPLVLVTSSRDFAVDGYGVGAADYLLKPVSYERLAACLLRLGVRRGDQDQAVELRCGTQTLRLDVRRLMRCEARGHYVTLYDVGGDARRVRVGFAELQAALVSYPQMYCCARGQLVNLDYVRELDGGDFVLTDGSRAPIRQRGVAQAKSDWASYLFDRMRGDG